MYRTPQQITPAVRTRMSECASRGDAWPLVLVGAAGTGKTCAALCMLDRVVGSRRYFTVAGMCEELVAVMKGQVEYAMTTDTPRRWWKRYADMECVVVDELGARAAVSDFQYESLKRAIDERQGRPAIFISNLMPDQLESVYDDRIASRLAGGTVIRFAGEDRRIG